MKKPLASGLRPLAGATVFIARHASLDPYKTKKAGVYRCKAKECRRDFTVTTGSVMERSHAKLTQWAVAFAMAAASKKGFSSHQLHRQLNCQYNTAWFMFHRVREAMRRGSLDLPPLGGEGKIVEADETYIRKARDQHVSPKRKGLAYSKGGRSGVANKRAIVALVERGGNVRSFHVKRADMVTISAIITDNIVRESRLHTDESTLYPRVGATFAAHETVKHSAKEYARGDVHTNTIEGVFSIFKRGMRGVYQHCSEKHLHRYLAEFDFRYNHREALGWTDEARTIEAVRGGVGKRLTYHQPN